MGSSFWGWVCWFLFLFILDFFIPFYVLQDFPMLEGSFAFWLTWIIVAIASMFVIFHRWQDYEDGQEGKRS